MRLISVPPGPLLRPFVEIFWFVRGRPDYAREKVLPNGAVELILNLGPPHKVVNRDDSTSFRRYEEAWIAGLQEEHIVIEAFDEFDLVGIRFRPGGIAPFLRCSPAVLTNEVVECREIGGALGDLVSATRERLLGARSKAEQVALLEQMLLARLDVDWRLDPAVRLTLDALRAQKAPSVAALSREAGISHKHMIDRFRRAVGTSPKRLLQINRLQSVIRSVSGLSPGEVRWATVAQQCGYYDQSHLIHDFRRFAGATPGEYLRARDADENHIVIDGPGGAAGEFFPIHAGERSRYSTA